MKYAADTTVDVARTRAELERLVLSEGASRFTTSSDEDRGVAGVETFEAPRLARVVESYVRGGPPQLMAGGPL